MTLSTVEQVQEVLRGVEGPASRNRLLADLRESGHATTRQRLNRVLGYFFRMGLAVEGSKGVQWTHVESESLRRALATGRRL